MNNKIEQQNKVYTCPMHPEIIQDKPGNCPICGMALELKYITSEPESNAELVDMSRRFWISLILTIPLLLLTMGSSIVGFAQLIQLLPANLNSWLQFILTTVVVFWCGWPLLKQGFQSLLNRHLNMFTLISLGTLVAYFFSIITLLFPQFFLAAYSGPIHLYFEITATIITLVLLGQVLELRGREQTGSAIRSLLDLTPKFAARVNAEGREEKISVENIHVNDVLHIRPGEKIPVDGIVIKGHSTIDESMITGESIPVEKTLDSKVIAGTVNQSGSLVMRALHVGNETLLAQIVKLVSEAQRSKAPIQRLADQVSGYFVPVVILIALITFFVWWVVGTTSAITYGLISAISVLIIACPCAIGLATPMSITVGVGRGAKSGILIKDAASLEKFEKINTLVIDKTGTLTIGKPSVKNIIALHEYEKNNILLYAASLEHQSEHPLANAIIKAANEQDLNLLPVSNFKAEIGMGIIGVIDQKTIALGNEKFMGKLGIDLQSLSKQVQELHQQGKTVIFLAIENKLAGLISVADPIKPGTEKIIKQLKQLGIHIIMLTGDSRTTAMTIADQLGIDHVIAEVLPKQKNATIKQLKNSGKIVAMAGDGINDAPALAEADIGIAMGTGTDVAIQSAEITLVKGDLHGIIRAYELSKKVMRNIRQNLFLAFIYNVLAIPIAAGILYPWTGLMLNPMIAALAMSLSSISVIGNSLRLRRVNLESE